MPLDGATKPNFADFPIPLDVDLYISTMSIPRNKIQFNEQLINQISVKPLTCPKLYFITNVRFILKTIISNVVGEKPICSPNMSF